MNILNFQQREILIGILLGDACIHYRNKNKKSVRLELKVGKKNFVYLEYLISIFSTLFKETTKIGVTQKSFYIKTKTLKELYMFYSMFYVNNKKTISNELLESPFFTAQSLAFWFMDDGHCENKAGRYKLSTQCFLYEDQCKLQQFLLNRFNIDTTLYKKDNSYILVIKKIQQAYLKH